MGERGEGRRKRGEKKREWGIGFPLTVCLGSSTCSSLRSSHCGTRSTPGCLFLLLGPMCCGLVEARKHGLSGTISAARRPQKNNHSDLMYVHYNVVSLQPSEYLFITQLNTRKNWKMYIKTQSDAYNMINLQRTFPLLLSHLLTVPMSSVYKPSTISLFFCFVFRKRSVYKMIKSTVAGNCWCVTLLIFVQFHAHLD